MSFEVVILKAIYALVGASDFLDSLLIFCARFLVYPVTIIFAWKLLVHREPYERLTKIFYSVLALVFSAGILQGALNYFFTRPVPSQLLGFPQLMAGSGGFPAFVTTWAVTIACICYLALSRRLGVWLFVITGIIGFAQIYTGLYWPADILVSIIIGVVGSFIVKDVIPPTQR